jgi:hypothetical protein
VNHASFQSRVVPITVVPITVFVGVDDVMRAIGCSRSQAYTYLREAAGRKRGDCGLLRVPAFVWERYADARFAVTPQDKLHAPRVRSKRYRGRAEPTDLDASMIPITRPRTRRRK